MGPDEPSEEERIEELPEDNQTPFSPAAPARNLSAAADGDGQPAHDLDDTHPSTDSNLEREEIYDEGLSGAAEATEPNTGNDVVDYHPNEEATTEPDER